MNGDSIQISYDDVPYQIYSFPQTHPDRLSVIGKLFGMTPALVDKCRVLELGCAQGGNIIPMAFNLPESDFLGIDLSSNQIAAGGKIINAVGLKNITLKQVHLLDFNESEGDFDYIIAHGVYSWIPENVQEKIFQICRTQLKPQGIAYISYNTYPGWRMSSMIRDMMLYHTSGINDPETKANQSRALVAFLSDAVTGEKNPYGEFLKAELKKLNKQPNSYIIHEFLEGYNEPCYFHDFVDRAKQNELQYLGEADFTTMMASNINPKVDEVLKGIKNNIIATEQYMDFLRNRTFRQTLLCHQEVKINRAIDVKIIEKFNLSTHLKPESDDLKIEEGIEITFNLRKVPKVKLDKPLPIAILSFLCEKSPQSVGYNETIAYAEKILSENNIKLTDDLNNIVCGFLMKCYINNVVEFSSITPHVVNNISEFPIASTLARHQAQLGIHVTDQRHKPSKLNLFFQQFIILLNGENDLKMIKEKLLKMVEFNEFTIQIKGEQVNDMKRVETFFDENLENCLKDMAKNALLIG
jgi:methyltransferase-like protein/SAM-dependent methyltransferase